MTGSAIVRDYTVPGPLAVNVGTLGMVMPTDYDSLQVALCAPSAPVGADVVVDVNRNGSTVFTTPENRPKLTVGSLASAVAIPDLPSGVAGDRITFDVDQIDAQPVPIASPAPTFVAVDVVAPGASQSSHSFTRPSLAQAGDLVLAAFWSLNSTDAMWTPPAGWVSAGSSFLFNGTRLHWFYRVDDGSAGPWLFTAAAPHTLSAVEKFTVRGVDRANPIDVYAVGGSNTSTSTAAVPAITTTKDNMLELLHLQLSGGRAINNLPATYAASMGFLTVSNRHAATRILAAAGDWGSFGLTFMGGTAQYQVTRFGIRSPALAPVVGTFEQIKALAVAVRYREVLP